MILSDHNGHLIQVNGQSQPADPVLGKPAVPGPVKWTGDCQVAVRDESVEEVRSNSRVIIRQPVLDIPSNLPVALAQNDLLTIRMNNAPQGELVQLEIRAVDRGTWGMGRYRYTCRYP